MAGTKQILQRFKATENISKVTHTMEMVSAVKYRRLYNSWRESIDFYDALAQLAYMIVTAEKTVDHPLLYPNASTNNAIIVTGSDRGLCGGYNNSVYRQIDVHTKMAKRFGRDVDIYAQGRKVITHLNNQGVELSGTFEDFDEIPSAKQTNEIADAFIDQFLNGQISRLGVVYTRFFSPASQMVQTLTVLPVADLIDDLTTRATVIWPWELNFEDFILSPTPEKIFDTIAKMMVRTSIKGCFLEAALSEHIGRVVAMRSATDNANEMMDDLTQEYNRARQSQITMELLDIIGATIK
ncbi:MAG: ATP synthase F1 subunit gamma [Sedimentisphaerales bacterium]|nr:ATP synthase F1 subunit gamma [Sedimentisphaerales bacterium]